MHEKALKDIRQFRLDVNEYLDKAEASMIAKAFDIMEENERLLTKLDHDCKTLSTEHIEITEKLDRELFKDNVLFIHAVECKPKLTASERYISEMKSMQIKTFKFEFDQQLRNILSSARNFGTYAISTSAVFNKNTKLADDEGSRSTLAVGASVKPTQILCNDCGETIPAGTSKFCQRCRRPVSKWKLKKRTPVSVSEKGDTSQIRIGSRVKLKTAEYGMTSYGAPHRTHSYVNVAGITGTVTAIFENGTANVLLDNGRVNVVKGQVELSLI